jgi:hypothetical protein
MPRGCSFFAPSGEETEQKVMVRTLERLCLGISLVLLCGTLAQAAAAEKTTKKDPIEETFTLPKGVTLTAEQQEQFDKLRADKEQELKTAWDEVQAAKDSAAKSAGMKKFNDVKKDIKTAISKILHPKGAGTSKPAPERKPKKEKPVKIPKEKPVRPGKTPPGGQPNFGVNPPAGGGF